MDEEGGQPGVQYEDDGTSVIVSEGAVKEFVNGVKAIASEFMAWAAANPLLFASILLFLLAWIAIRSMERVEKYRLKEQYKTVREEARRTAQQALPLEGPSPPGRQR